MKIGGSNPEKGRATMAIATEAGVELTPDDVLKLPGDVGYELVDGRLVELQMGSLSQLHATLLAHFLLSHCYESGLAHVFVEAGYVCFPNRPNRLRIPDVSCIRVDRLPYDQVGQGYMKIRPDVAIEVISPGDTVVELELKLDDYWSAEIPLVWLVFPESKRVRVLRPTGASTELRIDDELTGEDVLPGFRCPLARLFGDPTARIG
jgi:Uma2 family endonuclease